MMPGVAASDIWMRTATCPVCSNISYSDTQPLRQIAIAPNSQCATMSRTERQDKLTKAPSIIASVRAILLNYPGRVYLFDVQFVRALLEVRGRKLIGPC